MKSLLPWNMADTMVVASSRNAMCRPFPFHDKIHQAAIDTTRGPREGLRRKRRTKSLQLHFEVQSLVRCYETIRRSSLLKSCAELLAE